MRKLDLISMSLEAVINRYIELSVQQGEANEDDDVSRYNRLYKKLGVIDAELRSRGPSARLALTALFTHPNKQVRLNAATESLAIAPDEARAVLQKFRETRVGPYCLDAGMTIVNLDNGVFKPA